MVSLCQGSSTVSLYPVYRNGIWQRVPTLLLVKGDIIALGTGDLAPGKVEQLGLHAGASGASEDRPFQRGTGQNTTPMQPGSTTSMPKVKKVGTLLSY